MSRRHWKKITAPIGTLIILGLMLVAVTLIAPSESDTPVRSVQIETFAANNAQDRSGHSESTNEHAQKDLETQQDMVFWAMWMFWASFGSILVAAIAVFLVYLTLREARKTSEAAIQANEAADLSAKAAQAAVEVGQNTAKHQMRAYMVADSEVEWQRAYKDSPENIVGYNVSIMWKNCGVTPARRCQAWTNLEVFDETIPRDFDFHDQPGPKRMTETSHIGPGQGFQSKVGGLSISDAEAAERGKKHAYIWSWLEYDDIFGEVRHRTEVCFELCISEGGQTLTPTIDGPFNGADEDCYHKPKT